MEDKVQPCFTNAANSLTTLYKESSQVCQKAYEQGKIDTYQEIIEWMIQEFEGNLRYVPVHRLIEHLEHLNPDLAQTQDLKSTYQANKRFKPNI